MAKPPMTLLLDFDDQVRLDRDQPAAFLHRRDRRFALDCDSNHERPTVPRWLEYLDRVNRPAPGASQVRDQDPRLGLWRRVTSGFALAGAVLGILAMPGLLFYDGSQQINVTVILAFILLQLLMALATGLQSIAGWQPWRPVLHGVLERIRPSPAGPAQSVLRELHPQLMARAAHVGGLMFGLTGLLTLLVLVVVQDLAFGWSTTLDTGPVAFHRLIDAIATPWQNLWPAAVPSLDLVAQSRFFRLEDAGTSGAAAHWGAWWRFVAMSWLCYVILPRMLFLTLTQGHLRLRIRRLLANHPGLAALRYRMATPALETGNQEAADQEKPNLETHLNVHPVPDSATVIKWAGATDSLALTRASSALALCAGGTASLRADGQTLEHIRQHLNDVVHVVLILVRAWEPPTGELVDFLEDARETWPTDTQIALVPLASLPATVPDGHHLAQWLRFVERHPDLRLMVSRPEPGPTRAMPVSLSGYHAKASARP
ncbi:MAG: DUF2868 domain-containing protein [Oleiphilaceae bacterium]|nr:DUF2868 domain-containing protein [Oleiphilaceae bacterium]